MQSQFFQEGCKAGVVNEVSPYDSDWGQYLPSSPELDKAPKEEYCCNTLQEVWRFLFHAQPWCRKQGKVRQTALGYASGSHLQNATLKITSVHCPSIQKLTSSPGSSARAERESSSACSSSTVKHYPRAGPQINVDVLCAA